MPNSTSSPTAVVLSGGKQYRVASGDRILVDRLAAEPGSRLTLERVLMVADGDSLKLGAEALAGQVVTARVLAHRRGPKIDVLRYRPKKRVRVHRGARADLTALEILSIGAPLEEEPAAPEKPAPARTRTRRTRRDTETKAEDIPPETASEATETDPEAAAPDAEPEAEAESEASASETADEEKE